MLAKIKTVVTVLWTYILNATLGPITRATVVILDRDSILVQPTRSLLRTSLRAGQGINHIAGYPRYI